MKKIYKILIGVAAGLLILGVLKDFMIKSAVEVGAGQVLGAPVHIQGMSVGIFKQSVRIKGLRVDNPQGFPAGTFVDISEIGVDYDLPAILKGNLHLPLVVLKLKEMVIVKNSEGKLNVDALKVVQNKAEGKAQEVKEAPQMPMAIDTAVLDLGQVIVKDYTKNPPTVQAHDIGIHNKTFKNIKSAQQFAALILVQGMGPTALKSAAIYGAATVLGVAFLPAGVAGVLLSKDGSSKEYRADINRVYKELIEIINKSGQVESQNKEAGLIKAKIEGAGVTIQISVQGSSTEVKISARKMLLPKPEIAEGLLYQLSQKIK